MASSLLHIAIAKEINKELKVNESKLFKGSIAPDLAKILGQKKFVSHFTNNKITDIADIDLFVKRYPNFLDNAFLLGYFIHLISDNIWFNEIMKKHQPNSRTIHLANGQVVGFPECMQLVYNDYDSLNPYLIKKYDININSVNGKTDVVMTEVDLSKFELLATEVINRIITSKETTLNVFTKEEIDEYINETKKRILKVIESGVYDGKTIINK